jgi:hypothetical protein
MSEITETVETDETVEEFEAVLLEHDFTSNVLTFTLQLEEDLKISNSFRANRVWVNRMLKLSDSANKFKAAPKDRKVKGGEVSTRAQTDLVTEMNRMLDYVLGAENHEDVINYYSEKNEEAENEDAGEISQAQAQKLQGAVNELLYPKVRKV